jgi:hypothetical protein
LGQERSRWQGLPRVPDGYHGRDASGFFLSVDDTDGAGAGAHAQVRQPVRIRGVPTHAGILGWGTRDVKKHSRAGVLVCM